jgi:hypothetical protein
MAKDVLSLYQKHFVDKSDERLGLFVLMAKRFAIRSALYPGSFTHVTPSFVFPVTCFVDMDRRAEQFFNDPVVVCFVRCQKHYIEEPLIRFHHVDYSLGFEERDRGFDLLISQYAGFVSRDCKRYIRANGYLLANNSHGDAGMASIDSDYELVAVINRRGESYSLSEEGLDDYFIPKRDIKITKDYLEQLKRGVGYKRSAFSYVFRRIA